MNGKKKTIGITQLSFISVNRPGKCYAADVYYQQTYDDQNNAGGTHITDHIFHETGIQYHAESIVYRLPVSHISEGFSHKHKDNETAQDQDNDIDHNDRGKYHPSRILYNS